MLRARVRGALDVVGGTGGDTLRTEISSSAMRPPNRVDLAFQALLGVAVAVFLGQEHGHAERAPRGMIVTL
jgi:hypothetical protein